MIRREAVVVLVARGHVLGLLHDKLVLLEVLSVPVAIAVRWPRGRRRESHWSRRVRVVLLLIWVVVVVMICCSSSRSIDRGARLLMGCRAAASG